MKFCQGPECHMHKTKDRIKGTKGSKTYQTRRRSSFYLESFAILDVNTHGLVNMQLRLLIILAD